MLLKGYRMFAVRELGEVVAVAGIQELSNLYYERHSYVYDLVVTAGARSKGYRQALMETWKASRGTKDASTSC